MTWRNMVYPGFPGFQAPSLSEPPVLNGCLYIALVVEHACLPLRALAMLYFHAYEIRQTSNIPWYKPSWPLGFRTKRLLLTTSCAWRLKTKSCANAPHLKISRRKTEDKRMVMHQSSQTKISCLTNLAIQSSDQGGEDMPMAEVFGRISW